VNYDQVINFVQQQFSDGLAIVIGSGLSTAEGMPGMVELASHLDASAHDLPPGSDKWWADVKALLDSGQGLEAALLKFAPSDVQEQWIVKKTVNLLLPAERRVIGEVFAGVRELKLTSFNRSRVLDRND